MFTSLRLTTLSTDLLRFRSWIFCMVYMFRQNIDRKVVIRSTCRKLSLTMMYWKKRWEPEKEGGFCSKFWLFFYILWVHLQFFSPENFMDRMPIIWYFMYLCITHTHIYIYTEFWRVMFLNQPPVTIFVPQHFLGDLCWDDDPLLPAEKGFQPRSFFEVSKKQDGQADGRFESFPGRYDCC